MKAFVIAEPGATTVEPADVPVPVIGADELLVRVRAIGVGIHDSYFLPPSIAYPFPIGIEGAGTVDQVGSGVTGYRPGDRIAFVSAMQPKGGTWAEYAAVRADSLILPLPPDLGFAQAAALPVAGNTTLRAIAGLGDLPPDAALFVAGGSGAIGTVAIQLARHRGWRVGASASQHNHEYLHRLGAEKTVDYHHADWTEEILGWMPGGVDAAIAVQPATSADSMRVTRDGGSVVTVSGDAVTPERGIRVATIPHGIDVRADLARLVDDVAAGTVHIEIERVYPFAEARQALARVQTRHVRGKVVLTLDDPSA